MSKQRKRRKSLNAATPSTPKSKYHADDNMFATPKSHHIQDDDSDSSPYSLSFSQRAMGVEVTWGEKSRPTPFKSKKIYERRDTESPPTKSYFDIEPVAAESSKGLYKFLLGWERRRIDIEKDFESIETTSCAETSNHTSSSTNNDTDYFTATTGRIESPTPNRNSSPNLKQLLNDSEDMDLMLYSQRIEQEVCSRLEPPKPAGEATASKGFSECLPDNDDELLMALDDPTLLDKKLPVKSSFARHKSIAIQLNSSTNEAPESKLNSSDNAKTKRGVTIQLPAQQNQPSTPKSTATATASLVRHKSMPSPNVTHSTKKCSAEEIEIKRQNALAKLKSRKQRLTRK